MSSEKNKLTIGFSPCPNDCFIFDALVHGKIDTEGLEFEVVMEDVEALNKKAFENELDITKLSYHAYAYVSQDYALMRSGGALGKKCGPLVIAKGEKEVSPESTIAVPGKYTTANFLFNLRYPEAQNKKEMLFSDIENAVQNEEVDFGVIIHENRFTYQDKGLVKIVDLGEYWEKEHFLPIPLGGIVMKRSWGEGMIKRVDRMIKRSVLYAMDHPEESKAYVKQHAQEMDEQVMQQHIQLYVNGFSIDLGNEGIKAVETFLREGRKHKVIPSEDKIIIDQ